MHQGLSFETVLRWLRTVVIFLATLVICLLLLVFYQNRDMKLADTIAKGYLPQSPYGEIDEHEAMSLEVQSEISLSDDGLQYRIENDSGVSYSYSDICALEIFIDDAWFSVPLQATFTWDTTLYYLAQSDQTELRLMLGGFFKLIPGSYRLVKELTRSAYEQYRDTAYDAYQDQSILLAAQFVITE